MNPCTRCGLLVDPEHVAFDESGDEVCASCKMLEEVGAGDELANKALLGRAFSGLGAALVSMIFNPMCVLSLLAIGLSASALFTLERHPEYHRAMGSQVLSTRLAAGLGLLFGISKPALFMWWFLMACRLRAGISVMAARVARRGGCAAGWCAGRLRSCERRRGSGSWC